MKPLIITVGRQYASGGKSIARALSERLGIPCYDKELLAIAAKESNFCEEIFETNDERATKNGYYLGSGLYSVSHLPLNHQLFMAQLNAIRMLAEKESCVFIGRCADYALHDHDNCVNVFIHTDWERRKQRAQECYGIAPEDCDKTLTKMDKQRANYYSFYSAQKWGYAANYDLTLDSVIGKDQVVDVIIAYLQTTGKLQNLPFENQAK
ncbi:MAG: cytidylate kinase-like family protein [Peptococcaceae bacterium]|jgi:cytidylate kinase|nr:cytidylate kinase-like family protein [Peptococcaceae bacterium]